MSGDPNSNLNKDELDRAIALAQKEGFTVVRSTPMRLLVDLDTLAAREQFEKVLPLVEKKFGAVVHGKWESKSGNRHVVLRLDEPLDFPIRLALQAMLGSDGVRELLGLCYHLNGVEEPSVLFKPKAK